MFDADSPIRRFGGEAALLAGGGRAILLQVAHPGVAAGVAEHSDFRADPFRRLFGTLDLTYTIVFGSRGEAERSAATVRRVHDTVVGDGYSANDPDLLAWVSATLFDTAERFVSATCGPLDRVTAERWYQESCVVAEMLGCPRSAMARDLAEFRDYMEDMVTSLEVSDVGRRVAADVVNPPALPRVLRPVVPLATALSVAPLPERIAEQLDISVGPLSGRAVQLGATIGRRGYRHLPCELRTAPARWLMRDGRPGPGRG